MRLPVEMTGVARIMSLPKVGEKTVKLEAELLVPESDPCSERSFSAIRGRCLLRIERSEAADGLCYGDCILFSAAIREIQMPGNEGEFDYRSFLARKNIYRQVYLSDEKWELLGNEKGNLLMTLAMRWHSQIVNLFREGALGDVTKGIAATMLMGDDVMLDDEQSRLFQTAGVSHVLCVSGMHVGIIYLMMDFLLFFLNGSYESKVLKKCLIVLVIWFYACMVGLTASVVRSAIMFTFIAVGGMFRRQTRTYNSLLSAAFCMLLFRPVLLFEVGFQLSFLAVWGILWVQPMLQQLWSPRFLPLAYLWSVWTVSIAAQMFTFPISIFYFHQFPTWFLLSNIVVMSLAPFVMGISMLFLLVSAIPYVSAWIAKILNLIVWLMNEGVRLVTCLPHSVVDNLSLQPVQLFMVYLLILSFLLWMEKPSVRRACLTLCSLLCLLVYNNIMYDRQMKKCELNIYAIPKTFVAQYVENGSSVLFTTDSMAYCQGKFDYQLRNLLSVKPYAFPRLNSSPRRYGGWVWNPPYFQCGEMEFYYLKESVLADGGEGSIPVWFPDYLMVGEETHTSLAKALERLHPLHVCILCGTPAWKAVRWQEDCARAGVPCLWMEETGMLTFRVSGMNGGRLSLEAEPFRKIERDF